MSPDASLGTGDDRPPLNEENPWPGLLSFREKDSRCFFGRRTEIDQLTRLVLRERVTVLFGKSGLGKTSLLQAGLFPRARAELLLPVYVRLDHNGDEGLEDQVRRCLSESVRASAVEAPPSCEGESLWELLHRRDADFWNGRNKLVVPLFVFDQFEEIFTIGRRDAGRRAASETFVCQLADLVEGKPPEALRARIDEDPKHASRFVFGRHSYRMLLSLREDFLPELEGMREQMPCLAFNRMRLQPMSGARALEVASQSPAILPLDVAQDVVRFVAKADAHQDVARMTVEPCPAAPLAWCCWSSSAAMRFLLLSMSVRLGVSTVAHAERGGVRHLVYGRRGAT